jgi:hypothetical protein
MAKAKSWVVPVRCLPGFLTGKRQCVFENPWWNGLLAKDKVAVVQDWVNSGRIALSSRCHAWATEHVVSLIFRGSGLLIE